MGDFFGTLLNFIFRIRKTGEEGRLPERVTVSSEGERKASVAAPGVLVPDEVSRPSLPGPAYRGRPLHFPRPASAGSSPGVVNSRC